eukprot:203063_1
MAPGSELNWIGYYVLPIFIGPMLAALILGPYVHRMFNNLNQNGTLTCGVLINKHMKQNTCKTSNNAQDNNNYFLETEYLLLDEQRYLLCSNRFKVHPQIYKKYEINQAIEIIYIGKQLDNIKDMLHFQLSLFGKMYCLVICLLVFFIALLFFVCDLYGLLISISIDVTFAILLAFGSRYHGKKALTKFKRYTTATQDDINRLNRLKPVYIQVVNSNVPSHQIVNAQYVADNMQIKNQDNENVNLLQQNVN